MNNPFLSPESKLTKLIQQSEDYGTIIIGVDFDFTLYDSTKHYREGAFYEDILALVLEAQESPYCTLCLWTASKELSGVVAASILANLKWDYINRSPITPIGTDKQHFNLLLDDASGLGESVQLLRSFLDHYKEN